MLTLATGTSNFKSYNYKRKLTTIMKCFICSNKSHEDEEECYDPILKPDNEIIVHSENMSQPTDIISTIDDEFTTLSVERHQRSLTRNGKDITGSECNLLPQSDRSRGATADFNGDDELLYWDQPAHAGVPPNELSYNCCDIFVIHCRENFDLAIQYKKDMISSDVSIYDRSNGTKRKVRVLLIGEINTGSEIARLQIGMRIGTFMFLLVTKEYIYRPFFEKYTTDTLITDAFNSSVCMSTEYHSNIVTVYTSPDVSQLRSMIAYGRLKYFANFSADEKRNHFKQVELIFPTMAAHEDRQIKELRLNSERNEWIKMQSAQTSTTTTKDADGTESSCKLRYRGGPDDPVPPRINGPPGKQATNTKNK